MAKFNIEPSPNSYIWNMVRCSCILALIFVPADILGLAVYNVFYGADFAMLCMTVFAAIVLAFVGGMWFAFFDLKYARVIANYDDEIRKLIERIPKN